MNKQNDIEQRKALLGVVEEPKVGMKFDSIKDAEEMYYSYAGQMGFSVRKGSIRHSKEGLRKKTYVCSKEGKSRAVVPVVDILSEQPKKPRSTHTKSKNR
ncbi:hypothetical protein ZOSMA_147G00350 [Zostera marina]|uniref:FAR1 domain-containing protein n=1 Tax=Zostera marina TaxID=29655 RepID=A0A0K9PWT2_ZOSMR|nr:hypothetical protein ZOSMA_147G00350 [Zostera marina]